MRCGYCGGFGCWVGLVLCAVVVLVVILCLRVLIWCMLLISDCLVCCGLIVNSVGHVRTVRPLLLALV